MRPGLFATAMLLLAGTTVLAVAGIAALDASYSDSYETANQTGSPPPVLSLGKDVGSAVGSMIPYFALLAVPVGIAGILGIYAFAKPAKSPGRRR